MKWTNTSTGWGGVTLLFHWGMFLLIVTQYTLAYSMCDMPASEQKWMLFAWHKEIGVTLFFLTFLRLWWREYNAVPKDSEKAPIWMHFISKANIWILYGLMFLFPLTGFLMTVLGGHSVNYFNLFTISAFIHSPNMVAEFFLTAHITISYILYVFVGLHILGGLFHYFYFKDDVLLRIFPHR